MQKVDNVETSTSTLLASADCVALLCYYLVPLRRRRRRKLYVANCG